MEQLSPKQEKFCIEYARLGNARQAYIAAGYKTTKDSVTDVNACRLLKSAKVRARLAEIAKEAQNAAIADIVEIQTKLTAIMRGTEAEQRVFVNDLGETESYEVINQSNQIKSAELLAKMQGAFTTQHNVVVTVPVFEGEGDLSD